MHNLLADITVILGFCSVAFALPQAIRLYKLKDSRSFSSVSWVTWLVYQLSSVAYSVQIRSWVFAAINTGWTILYIAMVTMLVRYRPTKSSEDNSLE